MLSIYNMIKREHCMLEEYSQKRNFNKTPEPSPQSQPGEGALIFVIQKHSARRLHYDFRLEVDGVLKSWAIPNGPSLDPKIKRLAVMVEDHPIEYQSFEGVIPEGEYGAGQVIVWDKGSYSFDEEGKLFFEDRAKSEELMRQGLEKGKISFYLRGVRLKGSWALVRMQRSNKNWLLIKHHDEFAETQDKIEEENSSVVSGLTIQDLKKA
jgi:bifunctional non-homologous end joining protein LigD